MSKVLIAYATTSGNTEAVADWVFDVFLDKEHDVDLMDCVDLKAEHLADGYDMVVFGLPTYGCDEIEIQEDFEPILNKLEQAGLAGKKVAVFGLGDEIYPHFCGAVDVVIEKLRACQATLVSEPLKINDPHDEHKDEIHAWAEAIAASA